MGKAKYKTYLRWSGQRASDNTITDDKRIAEREFLGLIVNNVGRKAAAVLSADGKTQQYIRLNENYQLCAKCGYKWPFIDDGKQCPNCKLTQ